MHELARARPDRAPLPRCRRPALPKLVAGLAGALLALALPAGRAAAQGALPMEATRTLGMGSASRGHATGTAALSLNPSGISLARSYVVEGGYQFLRGQDGHVTGVAIADSTSAFNMGGGLYYTYGTASPEGAASFGRHEAGAALSFPFADKVMIGGALRYLRLHREALGTVPGDKQNGFTFDAGMTIRPVKFISVGVAR